MEMARIARASGIRQIVATPHNVYPPQDAEELFERVVQFNAALRHYDIDLVVWVGTENQYNLGSEALRTCTINNTNYLLIEFPHTHLPRNAGEVIFSLLACGLKPIIAHPERNPSIIRQPSLLTNLVNQGALAQLTAASLTGGFGPSVKRCSRYLLKHDLIHFLASDAHSVRRRPPVLSAGLEVARKLIGRRRSRFLVRDNPMAVLAGTPLKGESGSVTHFDFSRKPAAECVVVR